MSIWTRIADALSALAAGESLAEVFEKLRISPDRTVGFTIAVVALGAKMAKADGQVTRDEVAAFREVFHIPPEGEANAAKLFNMARTDVAGYQEYARKIRDMFGENDPTLHDLMEGLFHIAMADGTYHPGEDAFLHEVARIFGFDERTFTRVRAQFVPDAQKDPFDVLGVPSDASLEEARLAWRTLVRETHPDRLMARGVPEEAIKLAERRLIEVNRAWETISGAAG